MRITTALGLAFVIWFAPPAFGQSFVGEWIATAATPSGNTSETIKVVKLGDGFEVTAKLVGVPEGTPEAGPGTEIVLDGDRFSYQRTLTMPGGTLVITYTGVVSGDTFAGTVDLGFAKAPYTGVRIKAD
jgi:hypothetical protein